MKYNADHIVYNILIVDDIPENIQLLTSIFHKYNVNVISAINGIQALQSLKKSTPDLVLLDVAMPKMDGFEVCDIIHNNPKTKDIPVIFLTARSQKEDVLKGFEVGAVDYISKPFHSKELLSRVFAHLKLKKSQEIINNQNKLLSKRNAQITKSISYAKRIQDALLPLSEKINNSLDNYFVLYLPKDIVSGDHYWITREKDISIIAVIDSTGHGVPGAFMSIIGHNLLKEIVIEKKITEPDIILKHLNSEVNKALHSSNEEYNYQHDGMDVTICQIDHYNNTIKLAGANHYCYIVKNNTLEIIEGDIFSIGGLLSQNTKLKFTNHEFNIKDIQGLYMFSDGYQDQFGGPENKKFMVTQFKRLLEEIHNETSLDQKRILKEKFLNWKGNYDQIDDVLVFGIKFME